MAGEDKHSKKHAASDHKKRQLKKKGQVPKSTDVPMAAGLAAAFGALVALKGFYMDHMGGLMKEYFSELPALGKGKGDLSGLMLHSVKDIMIMSMPVLLSVMVIAVVTNVAQTGLIIASEPLKPNLNKLNPMTKLKQWFSVKSLQELLKSLVKILLAGYVGWLAWHGAIDSISHSVLIQADNELISTSNAVALMQLGASIIKGMFLKVILLYVVIAAIDYMFQRKNFLTEHKMTDKEVKDEYKQQEGDPYMKQKRKQMAYQIAMQQSQEQVPQGDVTVVNPTELAIVIKYDPDVSPVPYVIAKGEKRQADEIREASGAHGVPIVRNKPLARALFELCEIGDIVPAELFRPVAEVLAYVFALSDQEHGHTVAATQPGATDAEAAALQTQLEAGADGVHELGNIAVPVLQPAGSSSPAAGSALPDHPSLVPAAEWSPLTGVAPADGLAPQQNPSWVQAPTTPVGEAQPQPASPFSWRDEPPAW